MRVRLGRLNCPFPCSSVAISTNLNCGNPHQTRPAARDLAAQPETKS